jgi:hypothetical protein
VDFLAYTNASQPQPMGESYHQVIGRLKRAEPAA